MSFLDPDLREQWARNAERERADKKRVADAKQAEDKRVNDLLTRGPQFTFKETTMEPIDHVMQFFVCDHLPERLQAVSKPFCELANWIVSTLPRNPQRTIALNDLLAAKDAAVRALVAK